MRLAIKLMPLFLGLLGACFILTLFHTYSLAELVSSGSEKIEGRMKKKKKNGKVSYDEIQSFLLRNGAPIHFGEWISPASYLVIKIVSALLLGVVGMNLNILLLPVGAVLGYLLPELLVIEMNKDDNRKMSEQIATVYNTIQIQTEAGIDLIVAVLGMSSILPKGRLSSAFSQLAAEVSLLRDFDTAVENFNAKFDNEFIDSLCVILLQGAKTGKTQDLMKDISSQITDMQSAVLAARKDKIDRFVTFAIMGLMVCGMAVVIYAFVMMLAGLASEI